MNGILKILYVDDESDIRSIVQCSLEDEEDMELKLCASGLEALDMVTAYQPDLLLLDVMMPGMDGPTTLRRIRELPGMAQVPAAFVTAKVRPQEVNELKAMGAVDVISKPFEPMELADQVRVLYKKTRQSTSPQGNKLTKLSALGLAYGSELPQQLAALTQGWQIVATTDGWSSSCTHVHRLAHSLAGSAGTFGYRRLGAEAKRLEEALALLCQTLSAPSAEQKTHVAELLERLRQIAACPPDQIQEFEFATRQASEPLQGVVASVRRRIVLVEDDDSIRYAVKLVLESISGHEVLALSSGAQAVAEARRFSPDLLLLDVSMPEMDGPQTLAALRQQPGMLQVPAVFLTAHTQGREVALYRELGVSDIIAKPVKPLHLCERVNAVLNAAAVDPVALDLLSSSLVVEDDPSIRFLLDFILTQQGYRVIAAHNGNSGLQAINEGPVTDIVILDINLPDIDGLQLLERLRSLDPWRGALVMMVSSEGDEPSVARALKAGANDYLIKPFDPTELVARLVGLRRLGASVIYGGP